ncbi:unnamed protein product [Ectocarpus fasciculatus]
MEHSRARGSIPKELGALTNLKSLKLGGNRLTGSIPKELGALTRLENLNLGGNQLTGAIPMELGALTKISNLYLTRNNLTGSIPKELGALTNLMWLYLGNNQLTGSIPKELGALTNLRQLFLNQNQLTGSIPKELGALTKISALRLDGNHFTGPLPPTSYGRDMQDWADIPDDDEKSRVRAAGATEAGEQQPWIVRVLGNITNFWHVAVPVVDDVTDVLLLTSTADASSPLWWICLIALVVADIERLWLLCTLCVTVPLLPLLWCWDGIVSTHCRTGGRFFALLHCRGDAPEDTFVGRLLDSVLWVLVGSRSRCSPFWRMLGMSLDAKVEEAHHAGIGFGAIDKWVERHPFRHLGRVLFGSGFVLKGESEGVSRRAIVMIRAVGETLVVDSLFLALSVVSGGWDDEISGVAGISALFSILELVTELQYYVAEAGVSMEPVSSPNTASSGEEDAVSDPSPAGDHAV